MLRIGRGGRASRDQVTALEQVSRRIDKIVDAITNVSIQTNMLAVNGSVEAARAGEFGKGFAVVSTDIRNLARDSAENAERIKDTVKSIQDMIVTVRGDLGEISQFGGDRSREEPSRFRPISKTIARDVEEVLAGNKEVLDGSDRDHRAWCSEVQTGVEQHRLGGAAGDTGLRRGVATPRANSPRAPNNSPPPSRKSLRWPTNFRRSDRRARRRHHHVSCRTGARNAEGGNRSRAQAARDRRKRRASRRRGPAVRHLPRRGRALRASRFRRCRRSSACPMWSACRSAPPRWRGWPTCAGTCCRCSVSASVFGFPAAMNDDSTRVVVLNHGRPVGLVVDRMANVVTVEPERIEQASTIRSPIDADFVSGMIKEIDGRVDGDHPRMRGRSSATSSSGGSTARRTRATKPRRPAESPEPPLSADAEEDQLVSFEVAGQEYAFPIEMVKEIVQLPDHITEVPNTAGHILGVITLRNRLLPLVSLRGYLRHAPGAADGDQQGRRHRPSTRRATAPSAW